ncbi:hypothetical protein [Natrinema versiforme]|uniref:Uncharacterized protein n=1 Tax=Natrinema versiforme TaxID=88724 RepID=A0A4P8WKK8_9EURY|nr:hypothetical protein [Natrinema versiforme]QCS42643.1 hypothetical protein FEJ81_09835 [Natrinema versiforme]
MSNPDALVTEQALARTYDGGDYDDVWEVVNQYRRAITYHADNPKAGIGEIVRVADASRVSVQSWIDDGATPSVVQGLYTAHEYDWIGVTYEDLTPLNILAASVYSSGTISIHNWHPTFSVDDIENSLVLNALELIGVGHQDVETGADQSGPAVRPATDAAVLGRVLSVLGVPAGSKATPDDLSLPWYLEEAPESVRKRFVDIYLENRAHPKPDSAGLQISESRPRSYREELAELIESVAGESVTATDSTVMISADAARALGLESENTA